MTLAENEKSPARAGVRALEDAWAGGFKLDQINLAERQAQRKSAEEASRRFAQLAHQQPGVLGRQALALSQHYGRVHRQLSGVAQ